MPTVDVYGNSPGTGPGHMSANAACDEINEAHPTWRVTVVWTADNSQFTSPTATGANLKEAVEKKLQHYQYLTT